MRHENILEHGHDLLASEPGVAHIHGIFFQFSGVAGLAAINVAHPFGIGGYGTANCPGLLAGPHGQGWHDENFVGVEHPCLMQFGPINDDAF